MTVLEWLDILRKTERPRPTEAESLHRKLSPARRGVAETIRRLGFGREFSGIVVLGRWYAAWTRQEGLPDVRVRPRRGNLPAAVLIDLRVCQGLGRMLGPDGIGEVARILQAASVPANGRVVVSPLGLSALAVPLREADAVAANVVAALTNHLAPSRQAETRRTHRPERAVESTGLGL